MTELPSTADQKAEWKHVASALEWTAKICWIALIEHILNADVDVGWHPLVLFADFQRCVVSRAQANLADYRSSRRMRTVNCRIAVVLQTSEDLGVEQGPKIGARFISKTNGALKSSVMVRVLGEWWRVGERIESTGNVVSASQICCLHRARSESVETITVTRGLHVDARFDTVCFLPAVGQTVVDRQVADYAGVTEVAQLFIEKICARDKTRTNLLFDTEVDELTASGSQWARSAGIDAVDWIDSRDLKRNDKVIDRRWRKDIREGCACDSCFSQHEGGAESTAGLGISQSLGVVWFGVEWLYTGCLCYLFSQCLRISEDAVLHVKSHTAIESKSLEHTSFWCPLVLQVSTLQPAETFVGAAFELCTRGVASEWTDYSTEWIGIGIDC